jgi:hypothetical protein
MGEGFSLCLLVELAFTKTPLEAINGPLGGACIYKNVTKYYK